LIRSAGNEVMLLLDHDSRAEKISQRLDRPQAEEHACKNKQDAKGKKGAEEILDVELGSDLRQVERQGNPHREHERDEEGTASIARAVSCRSPLAQKDPKLEKDPGPKARRKNDGIDG